MSKVTVNDGNGHLFDGELARESDTEKDVRVWTKIDGENGFGQPEGQIVLLTGLKKLDDGSYGA